MKSRRCSVESKAPQSVSYTSSLTFGAAAHGGALDGGAGLVHTPAEAGGVPALHGLVAALLVTLGRVGTEPGDFGCGLHLAFGFDQSG